jgi:hypothetical protein
MGFSFGGVGAAWFWEDMEGLIKRVVIYFFVRVAAEYLETCGEKSSWLA